MSALYIHTPFCKKKCSYCSFYSSTSIHFKEEYLHALHQEIATTACYLEDREITTLYFGGGTPSLLSVKELETILKRLAQHYSLQKLQEFTVEVNPESVSYPYFKDLLSIGVNRLSVGIQSFQPHVLQFIQRIHTEKMAHQALENALKAGFTNLSADLIYGISCRQTDEWRGDVHQLLQYPITHLSAYALTIEENTALAQQTSEGSYHTMQDSRVVDEWKYLIDVLRKYDIYQYEISNYARKGFESQHNSVYWTGKPYLGLGPSAHSYNGKARRWNVPSINSYVTGLSKNTPCFEEEFIDETSAFNEKIILGLRLNKGLCLASFSEEEQLKIHQRIDTLDNNLYQLNDNYLQLTFDGMTLLDHISLKLMEVVDEE